eukprot:CAMPEP_0204606646 /NCGR_PEP_ID=MMETSP0661-20131031/59212_1 /ASSEMBLY_ACC=CAM_ASM_000606 /TAXON_ID=109239 /ORGANISM="Alexandrium margalefi, Strain AMGDE01CS-322" /LENGTH=267 /DNA_ID=CAMNT_0051617987 /DNA_START=61 /DNA_END=864 /DNA_ORIENTATION=-
MWAQREIVPAHYNAQGPVMPWRPYGTPEMSAEDAPVPTVYVEASRRRDAEAFAGQLEEMGAPPHAPPEAMEYARMDAAALLQRLAGPDKALLEELQAAVVAKDMAAFAAALEGKKVGNRSLRQELQAASSKGDKAGMADALRRLGLPALNVMMARSGPRPVMAKEIGGPHDPVMGTERRCAVDAYLTGKPMYPKSFDMRRPLTQEGDPIVYSTIALGYDAAAWELDCLYHPYVHDAANAACDLMIEAEGTGELDGRLNGTRPFGMKY